MSPHSADHSRTGSSTRGEICGVANSTAVRITLALLLPILFIGLLAFLVRPVQADSSSPYMYAETFDTTVYRDSVRTTAVWDTVAGQLRLQPPAPSAEGVAGQLYYPSVWSAVAYVAGADRAYLFGGSSDARSIQEYDPATKSSRKVRTSLPHELRGAAGFYVESRQRIYLIGGNLESTDILFFDPSLQQVMVLEDRLPSPLAYASAVYVASQDKAYIFGGMSGDSPFDTLDTILEYDLAADTVITLPVRLPASPLGMSSAIYDPATHSAYIFGGRHFDVPTQRIAKFDVITHVTPTIVSWLPVACSGTSAIYVPERGKVYIFGGQGAATTVPLSQTVEFNIANATATALAASLPVERSAAAAVYSPARGTAYILGGQSGPPSFPLLLSDIVAFDVNARTAAEIGTAVDGRSGASAVYVPSRRKVYLFGGASGYEDAASPSILAYDVDRVTTDVLRSALPVSRTDTAAVYDEAGGQVYVFGGWLPGDAAQYFAEILRFDVAAGTLVAAHSLLPSGRAGMSAVQAPSGRVYLFGGVGDGGCLDQILSYDPTQDQLTVVASRLPVPAAYASAVLNATTGEVYLFGGWNPDVAGDYLDQIVVFDLERGAVTLLPTKLPFIRAKAAAFAIPDEGIAYVLGGTYGPGRHLGDVLRFDAQTRTVTRVEGITLPVPRSGEAAVYVPDAATAYLFGGTGYGADRPLADIVMLKLAYALTERAQSLRVSAAGHEVHQALLTAQQTLRGGSVAYALSNDGGQTWRDVRPGLRHVFATPGSDLRWRAVLNGNGKSTPTVDALTITYDGIDWYWLFLPVILRAYR